MIKSWKRIGSFSKSPKKDLDPVLDPPWNNDLRSDHFLKKGSRSGSLDPGYKDPKGMCKPCMIELRA